MNAGSKSVRRFAANNGERIPNPSVATTKLTHPPSIPLTRQHMFLLPEPPLKSSAPVRLGSHRDRRTHRINNLPPHPPRRRPKPGKSIPHPRLPRRLPPTSHHPKPHELRRSILPLPEAPERASRPAFQQILLLQEGNARGRRMEAQSQKPPDCGQRYWCLQRLRRRGVERRGAHGRSDGFARGAA
jgi:hypothetical protein